MRARYRGAIAACRLHLAGHFRYAVLLVPGRRGDGPVPEPHAGCIQFLRLPVEGRLPAPGPDQEHLAPAELTRLSLNAAAGRWRGPPARRPLASGGSRNDRRVEGRAVARGHEGEVPPLAAVVLEAVLRHGLHQGPAPALLVRRDVGCVGVALRVEAVEARSH